MKKIVLLNIAILLVLGFSSCSELTKVAQQNSVSQETQEENTLTSAEMSDGIREALRVAIDSAVTSLSATDGYYGNDLVKILLPPEADIIVDNASKIPGADKLIDNVVVSINRAAEDAAKDAGPIFFDAIKEMSITDAASLLAGGDSAATKYFKDKTYDQLFDLYQPKMSASLDKKLVANYSAADTWETLTTNYNKVANSFVGKLADWNTVETQIDTYLTEKALDGLFLKMAQEEAKIRTDPKAQVNDLLEKVFGS